MNGLTYLFAAVNLSEEGGLHLGNFITQNKIYSDTQFLCP